MKHDLHMRLKSVLVGGALSCGVALYRVDARTCDAAGPSTEADGVPPNLLLGVPNPVMMTWHSLAAIHGAGPLAAPDYRGPRACCSKGCRIAVAKPTYGRMIVLWDEY